MVYRAVKEGTKQLHGIISPEGKYEAHNYAIHRLRRGRSARMEPEAYYISKIIC